MAVRTSQFISTPSFIADPASIDRSSGRQVDWEKVDASFAGVIPAGHRVYETEDGKIVPEPGDDGEGNPVNELIGLIETNAIESDNSAALSGYGVIVGGVVYTELLPEELEAEDLEGLAEVGTGFAFETYSDSRAS